jgi:N-methylhydantoinase B
VTVRAAVGGPAGLASDPVALEILWARLIAIADEAATTLVRTSFSPIVRESNDFSCVLFDAEGNAVAENTIGIPSFNMTMGRTLAHLLRTRPLERWEPGDVAMTNDPWLASGHLPDMTVLAPIFRDGRLLGWAGSIAHQADVGGSLWSADTREVYEEGVRVPPKLLFRAGRRNEDLVDLLRANVRMPDQVIGDLMAQVAAGEVASRRLLELVGEAGLTDLGDLSSEVCARAERAMRRSVAEVPDGVYRGALDLDGTGEEPVHLEAAVTVSGDRLLVDYAGTSPQVARALNVVMNYTEAYTCYPLKCALDPTTPRNEGSYRCIEVSAPDGSILNPRSPAPVNARQLVGHCLAAVLYQALAPVLPDRVVAESGSAPGLRVVISGPRDERSRFTSILFLNGGMGARRGLDGLATTSFPSNVVCGAMEIIEATAPVRVWRKELAVDSGGPGTFRGGLGQEVEIELLAPGDCTLSLFVEHAEHPPLGLFGGGPGAPARVVWNGRAGGFPLKGRSRIRPGDRLQVRYPGGGGYGDPRRRARDAVLADVEAGVVSPRQARDVYGRQ